MLGKDIMLQGSRAGYQRIVLCAQQCSSGCFAEENLTFPSVCSCVSMLADLYHAENACGTATVGSSEVSACITSVHSALQPYNIE